MIGTIYRIYIDLTGESFVGRTIQDPREVWMQAKSKLKRRKHLCKPLQEAVNKYGLASAKFEILDQIDEGDSALAELQSNWMKKFKTFNKKITWKPRKARAGRQVTWNGITYPTLSAAARATGKKMRTLQQLIDDGYEGDDDYEPLPFEPIRLETEWERVKYRSMREAADAAGIKYSTMRRYRQLKITSAAAAAAYYALEDAKQQHQQQQRQLEWLRKNEQQKQAELEKLRETIRGLRG